MIEALIALISLAVAAFLAFVGLDAKAAFDNDPNTPTLSSYIKPIRALAWGMVAVAFSGATYLLLHFGFQVF